MPDYAPDPNPFGPGDPFPHAVTPDYAYTAEVETRVRIVESYSRKEKRAEQAPARLIFRIGYQQLTPEDADTLWAHYLAQTGQLSTFDYENHVDGNTYSVRYRNPTMSRETFLFEAERSNIELIEVL